MKKFGFCLLALCLVGYVAGCGEKETETTPPAPSTGTESETETPTDPPADTEGDAN